MSNDDASAARKRSRRAPLAGAALVVAGLVAYASSFGGAFVLDDLPHIVHNPRLAREGVLAALADTRPLVSVSLWCNFALDRMLGGDGLDPVGYHLFNLVVHLAAGLALFGVARRGLAGRRRRAEAIGFAIALLWIVHPLTTQAVTYVIQRSESMMAMFALVSIYLVSRGADRGRWGWYVAAVAAGWLSCASKQVAVVLPLVVLLYDRAFLAGTFRGALRRRWLVYVGLAIGSIALVASAVAAPGDGSAGFGMQRLSPLAYAMTQPGVILHYLRLAVWPAPLVFDYGWPVATDPLRIAASAAAVAALVAAAGAALWRRPGLGFVGASFFLVLAPTSSIMPIADLAVEHRMYLPLAAVIALAVLAAAWLLRCLTGPRWLGVGAGVLAAATVALGATTFARNNDYHDPADLWRQTIAAVPLNARAYHNLGNVLFSRGEVEASLDAYRRAVELRPDFAMARVNLGVALVQAGQTPQAEAQFRAVLERQPRFAPALNQLGILLAKAGDPEAAAAMFKRAIRAAPRQPEAYINLGHTNFQREAWAQAGAAYREALRLGSDDPLVHNNLGVILARSGRLAEAAEQFARAVRLDPSFADAQANLRRARAMLRRPEP